jgi:hypothetical protein
MLVLEGTGLYCPFVDELHRHKFEYEAVVRGNEPLRTFANEMIYRPITDPQRFFYNTLKVATNVFLQRYNLPLGCMYMTRFEPQHNAEQDYLFMSGPCAYGATFDELASMSNALRIVVEPMLTRQEFNASIGMARTRTPMLKLCANTVAEELRNMPDGQVWNVLSETRIATTGLSSMFIADARDQNVNWRSVNDVMLNDAIHGARKLRQEFIEARMHPETLDDGGTGTGNNIVTVLFHVQPRFLRYEAFRKRLLDQLLQRKRIVALDYIVECISDCLSTITLCFSVASC